jgi:hypothetical protein
MSSGTGCRCCVQQIATAVYTQKLLILQQQRAALIRGKHIKSRRLKYCALSLTLSNWKRCVSGEHSSLIETLHVRECNIKQSVTIGESHGCSQHALLRRTRAAVARMYCDTIRIHSAQDRLTYKPGYLAFDRCILHSFVCHRSLYYPYTSVAYTTAKTIPICATTTHVDSMRSATSSLLHPINEHLA